MTLPNKINKELIQRIVAGDVEAFADLFREHFQLVYNYALSLCNDPAMAEDLTQEAFIRAHANLNKFGPPWNFRTWLFRLTRNYYIDLIRKDRDVEVLEDCQEVSSTAKSPEKETMMSEVAKRVHDTLQQLHAKHREILVLRELNGFSYAEIAEVMNISNSNVKVMLHRARADFQESYGIRLLLEEPEEGCREVIQLLNLLHDGESQHAQEKYVKDHLKGCEACQQRQRWLITQSAIFGAVIPAMPPSSLMGRIFEETGISKQIRKAHRVRMMKGILTYGGLSAVLGGAAWLLISAFGNPGNTSTGPIGIGAYGSAPISSGHPSPTPTATSPQPPNLPPLTLAPSSTPTPTSAARQESSVRVLQQTMCWVGPGEDYEVVSSLKQGDWVEALGSGEMGGYLVVLNPRYGVPCWVKEHTIDVGEVDLFSLPLFKIPPLPTQTPTTMPLEGCWVASGQTARPKCVVPCPDATIYKETCVP